MRRALLTLALALLVIGTARAADPALAGFYDVDGRNADGKPYAGVVQIVATGQTYHVRWVMEPAGEEAFGVGLLEKDVLVVSFTAGQMLGIARYKVKKGTLTGTWSFPGLRRPVYRNAEEDDRQASHGLTAAG